MPSVFATAKVGAARLVLSWLWLPGYPAYREELRVLAGNGGVTLERRRRRTSSTRRAACGSRTAPPGCPARRSIEAGPESGFVHQLVAFADAIEQGTAPFSGPAGAAADTRSLQALVRAVAAGQGVEVGGEAAARA